VFFSADAFSDVLPLSRCGFWIGLSIRNKYGKILRRDFVWVIVAELPQLFERLLLSHHRCITLRVAQVLHRGIKPLCLSNKKGKEFATMPNAGEKKVVIRISKNVHRDDTLL